MIPLSLLVELDFQMDPIVGQLAGLAFGRYFQRDLVAVVPVGPMLKRSL